MIATGRLTLNTIVDNIMNDYSSGEMGHFAFSPSVYDMLLIIDLSENIQKGYTIQEFLPVL